MGVQNKAVVSDSQLSDVGLIITTEETTQAFTEGCLGGVVMEVPGVVATNLFDGHLVQKITFLFTTGTFEF